MRGVVLEMSGMLLIGKEGEPDSSSIARERCRSSAASSVELCTETPPSGGESSCVRRRRRPQEVDEAVGFPPVGRRVSRVCGDAVVLKRLTSAATSFRHKVA